LVWPKRHSIGERAKMVAVLDFLTKHFLVLSTVITSVMTASTLIFIASYLSMFDFSLTLIIEYTDILKFVFIALGIASWLALTILGLSRMAILSFNGSKTSNIVSWIYDHNIPIFCG
jgi:hypothetical protein